MSRRRLKLAGKILELFINGFTIAFARGKSERRQLHEYSDDIWYSIDRKQLYRVLDNLLAKNILKIVTGSDKVEKIFLNERNKTRYLKEKFRGLQINRRPRKWDKNWRIVLFDIPEKLRQKRNALRNKLKSLGFLEFQKSVFIYPFSCEDEVNFVINYLEVSKYAYYIESEISPDHNFKKHFKLK